MTASSGRDLPPELRWVTDDEIVGLTASGSPNVLYCWRNNITCGLSCWHTVAFDKIGRTMTSMRAEFEQEGYLFTKRT